MSKFIDLTGKKFGKWTVLKYDGNRKWICRCECGNIKRVFSGNLICGKTKTCGCGHIKKHGQYRTRLYHIWVHMKGRCYNKNEKKYCNYGGRGIILCDDWNKDFRNFYEWSIKNGYKDNLTIDRIDSNGNYCPENCRWITLSENSKKTRSVKISMEIAREIRGKKGIMQKDLAEMYNVSKGCVWHILHNLTHKELTTN